MFVMVCNFKVLDCYLNNHILKYDYLNNHLHVSHTSDMWYVIYQIKLGDSILDPSRFLI